MRPHLGSLACGIDGYAGAEDAGEVGEEGHGQVRNRDGEASFTITPSGGGNIYRLGGVLKAGARATKIGTHNPSTRASTGKECVFPYI